jgi:hypothetical protein
MVSQVAVRIKNEKSTENGIVKREQERYNKCAVKIDKEEG